VLDPAALRARLDSVRDRIAKAAGRAGRDPATVCLVAISKTFPVDHVRAAADAGQLDFGENKLQEALVKMDATRDLPLRWHLVGHLQSNKARKAGGRFDVIHSIDDAAVAGRVDEGATAARRAVRLLVQVDLAREPTKHGVPAELVHEILRSAGTQSAARMAGLMVLPPAVAVPESARPYFTRLRELRDELLGSGVEPSMLGELSMGMSHDFEVAIEEGATLVRIGSAIFGARPTEPTRA
jgi:pyridoxal phosphate enzyme (YggS family)